MPTVKKICQTKQELDEFNEPGIATWLNPETDLWEQVVIQGPLSFVCINLNAIAKDISVNDHH